MRGRGGDDKKVLCLDCGGNYMQKELYGSNDLQMLFCPSFTAWTSTSQEDFLAHLETPDEWEKA